MKKLVQATPACGKCSISFEIWRFIGIVSGAASSDNCQNKAPRVIVQQHCFSVRSEQWAYCVCTERKSNPGGSLPKMRDTTLEGSVQKMVD